MSDILIEKLVVGGDGLARLHDGQHVFVRGGLPGDRVDIQEQVKKQGALRAVRWSISQPSPERVQPPCPVANSCGGCDWMALSMQAQREHKLAMFMDGIVGSIALDKLERAPSLITAGEPLGYRNRLRLKISKGKIGFLARRSHMLVEPERCLVATNGLSNALTLLRKLCKKAPGALDAFDTVELSEYPPTVSLYFVLADQHAFLPLEAEGLIRKLRATFSVAIGTAGQKSEWPRSEVIDGTYCYFPPGGFGQVNQAVNRLLVAAVVEQAQGLRSYCDLYAGSGNFSLPLARAGLTGIGVESHPVSAQAGQLAAAEQGLDTLSFTVADSADAASALRRQNRRFDLVIADPPRAGIKNGLEDVAFLARKRLLLCSCDLGTFARDLRRLATLGFELKRLDAFDMFPQTHHVEGFASLTRIDSASG
jgi:23S rRNA (uracil1939-C5)-methyltransferase